MHASEQMWPSPVEIDAAAAEAVGPQLRERNSLDVASPEPVQPANTMAQLASLTSMALGGRDQIPVHTVLMKQV